MFSVATKKRAREASQRFLIEIGIPASHSSFYPLAECIATVAEFPDKVNNFRVGLFPEVIRKTGCKACPESLRKNSEYLIRVAFSRCPEEKKLLYFGACIDPEKGYPTLKEFLACAGVEIRDRVTKKRGDYL